MNSEESPLRKIIVGALTALLLIAGAFVTGTQAAPREGGGPGPNGSNEKGLCTAYFNGQKEGHNKDDKPSPGPFGALEDDAKEYDEENTQEGAEEDLVGEDSIASDVFEFCEGYGIMGNPEENGRFDCREGEERDSKPRDGDVDENDDPAPDGEIECYANGTEDDDEPTPAR